jgi:hypothetical protein
VGCTGTFEFTAPLWRYPGEGGWHFVSLPPEIGNDIADVTAGIRAGFGSVRVAATVGTTSWRTSIFPDSKTGTYLLPVKKEVRDAEKLETGDEVWVQVQIVDR